MPARKGKKVKSVIWFGIRLSPSGAQILYIISILGVIGCLISLAYLLIGMVGIMSIYAAFSEYGFYMGLGIPSFILYIVVDIGFLIFFLYNIKLVKGSR